MIFRSIYLDLDRIEFGNEFGYSFLLQSRALCHFLQRKVKPIKFKSDGFNRLVVKGTKKKVEPFINSSNVLSVRVPFKEEAYRSSESTEDLNEFYIEMLKEGMNLGDALSPLPIKAINEGIREFRESGYSTSWSTPRRRQRERALIAFLECQLSINSFELYLVIERKKEQIYRDKILVTDPDEIAFHYRFKDIVFGNDTLTVTSKTSEPLLTMNLKEIEHKK